MGRRRFADLLTVGGKLYHETHFAPLLRMQGEVGGVALELRHAPTARRLPVLVTSTLKTGADGQPLLIRTTVFDARDRRAYEQELLRARQEADRERDRLRAPGRHPADAPCCPPACRPCPGWTSPRTTTPPRADQVGGDFYDLFPLADGRWGLFLGDVCGKGADAAAVTVAGPLHPARRRGHDPDPVAVLPTLNTVLHQRVPRAAHSFCTVLFGVLTAAAGRVRRRAGQRRTPPALLLRADGAVAYQPDPRRHAGGRIARCHVHRHRTVRLAAGRHPAALHRRADRGPHRDRRRPLRGGSAAGIHRRDSAHHSTGRRRRPDHPADRASAPGWKTTSPCSPSACQRPDPPNEPDPVAAFRHARSSGLPRS